MLLVPLQLFGRDLASGALGGIDSDLVQRQQVGSGVHDTARY